MSNVITSIYKKFLVKNSGMSCLALPSWHSARAIWEWTSCSDLHAKHWFKVAICDESCTFFSAKSLRTHGLVVKVSRSESGDVVVVKASRSESGDDVTWIRFRQGTETLCSPSAILLGTEPVSALTRAHSYCCTLFSFSAFILLLLFYFSSNSFKVPI